ncbi:MAG: LmeA family phospholipid-binding protein [Rubrobacteraceae bacterium]
MRRLLSAGLVVLVTLALLAGAIALIGAYTFLPPILEAAVAGDVRDDLGLAETPGVMLESDPQPTMLAGKFSDGRVSIRDGELGGVRAESATVDLDPFDVDVLRSVRRGEVVGEEPLSGRLRVAVSEEEITHLAGENADVPVSGIELERDRVIARSSVPMFGVEVPVSVAGSLDLRDGSLVFEAGGLEAAGVPVPDELADQLLSGAGFAYPLEELPDGVTLTGAEVEEGRLILTGEAEGIPLGAAG